MPFMPWRWSGPLRKWTKTIELRAEISRLLSTPHQLTVCQVNAEMARLCERIYPRHRQASTRTQRAWETTIVQDSLAQMWGRYHHLQKVRRQEHCRSLRSCFTPWKALTAFSKSHRALRKAGKQKQKNKFCSPTLKKRFNLDRLVLYTRPSVTLRLKLDLKECRYVPRRVDSLRMKRPWKPYRHTAPRYLEVEMTWTLRRPSLP